MAKQLPRKVPAPFPDWKDITKAGVVVPDIDAPITPIEHAVIEAVGPIEINPQQALDAAIDVANNDEFVYEPGLLNPRTAYEYIPDEGAYSAYVLTRVQRFRITIPETITRTHYLFIHYITIPYTWGEKDEMYDWGLWAQGETSNTHLDLNKNSFRIVPEATYKNEIEFLVGGNPSYITARRDFPSQGVQYVVIGGLATFHFFKVFPQDDWAVTEYPVVEGDWFANVPIPGAAPISNAGFGQIDPTIAP